MDVREAKAVVSISILMQDGEDISSTEARLVDLLYEALCGLADHHIDFEIESVEEI